MDIQSWSFTELCIIFKVCVRTDRGEGVKIWTGGGRSKISENVRIFFMHSPSAYLIEIKKLWIQVFDKIVTTLSGTVALTQGSNILGFEGRNFDFYGSLNFQKIGSSVMITVIQFESFDIRMYRNLYHTLHKVSHALVQCVTKLLNFVLAKSVINRSI